MIKTGWLEKYVKRKKGDPADLKDNETYKDVGAIERQKALVPRVDSAKLIPPKWLPKGAKAEWRRVVGLYRTLEIEVLNDLDQAVLVSYVIEVDLRDRLYREWLIEEKLMCVDKTNTSRTKTSSSGIPIEGAFGETTRKVVNPILREIERHNATIRVLAEQLALTPAGRAAYAVRQEKANRSPVEEFMGD